MAPATGPFTVTKNVPATPSLRGLAFVWQAIALDSSGVSAVGNPSPCFVR